MSTVLRVKRRAEESPQETLVLLSKRLKTESAAGINDPDLALNVFIFSGTLTDQENVSKHVKRVLSRTDSKQLDTAKKNATQLLERIRQQHKDVSSASRYEILNLSRGLKQNDSEEEEDENFAVVDVAKRSEEEKDGQYAYDLYLSQKRDFDVSTLDDVVRIEDVESKLMFGSHRDNGRRTPSDASSVDSEDSNDENNWRNEYPDTEGSSIVEEDMRRAVEDIDIGNDLSSDADEEEIYNDPSVDIADLNTEDVDRYGPAYAKYKARVLSQNVEDKSSLVLCTKVEESDEETSDGYKEEEDGFYYGMDQDTEQFSSQYRQDESDDDIID